MGQDVPFPDLDAASTLELPQAVMMAMASAFTLSFEKFLGLGGRILVIILIMPIVLHCLALLCVGVTNAIVRHRWAHGFRRRINTEGLQSIIQNQPERYILHVRYYGGFDASPVGPAAVLEDQKTDELMAIYPCTGKAVKECEQVGVRIKSK